MKGYLGTTPNVQTTLMFLPSSHPNGRLFKVPGTYKVQYFVIGKKGDIYKRCSFNITLTCKLCLPFIRGFN